MFHKLKVLRRVINRIDNMDYSVSEIVQYHAVKQRLCDSFLHSVEKGTASPGNPDTGLVVSLTTHGRRIDYVPYAIESVFGQTVKPDRVVLYLGAGEFEGKTLPIALQRQMERGLEIRYVEDIGPHTKLIPALKEFPEATIITVDDDYMYPYDMIERLVRVHENNPGAVCCSHSTIIEKASSRKLKSSRSFPLCVPDKEYCSPALFAQGFGGILYPPHSLPEEVFDIHLMKDLDPHADDIWFKAMELLAGTPVVQMPRDKYWYGELTSESHVQSDGLLNYNVNRNGNDVQFEKVFSHFGLYDKID